MPTRRSAPDDDRSIGGFLSNLAGGLGETAVGLGQLGIQAITDPAEFITETVPEIPGAIGQDLGNRYGMLFPGGRPAGEFGEELYEQPSSYLLDALDLTGAGIAAPAAARGARALGRGAKGKLTSFLDEPLRELPQAPMAPPGGGYAGSLSDELQSLVGPAAAEARMTGTANPFVDDIAPAAPQAQFRQQPETRREMFQQFMQPRREMVGSEAGAISFNPQRGRFADEFSGESAPMPGQVRGGMEDALAQSRSVIEERVNKIATDFQKAHSRILFEQGKEMADGFLANRDAFFKAHPAAAEVQQLQASERAMHANLTGDVGMQQAWNVKEFGTANPYGGRAGGGGAGAGDVSPYQLDPELPATAGEGGILEPGYGTKAVGTEQAPSRIQRSPLTERMYGEGVDPTQLRQYPPEAAAFMRDQLEAGGPRFEQPMSPQMQRAMATPQRGQGIDEAMAVEQDVLRTGQQLERSNLDRRIPPAPEESVPIRPQRGSPQSDVQQAGGRLAAQSTRREAATAAEQYRPQVHIDGTPEGGSLRDYTDAQLEAVEQEGINAYFDQVRDGNIVEAESLMEDARMARAVLDSRRSTGPEGASLKYAEPSQNIYGNQRYAEAPSGLRINEAELRGKMDTSAQLDEATRERIGIANQRRYAEDVLKATGRTRGQRAGRRQVREEARRPPEQVRRRTEQEKATSTEVPASESDAAAQVLRDMGWDEARIKAAFPGVKAKETAKATSTRTEKSAPAKPKVSKSKRRSKQENAGVRGDVDELSDAKLQKKIDYWKGQGRDDAYTKALQAESARRGEGGAQRAANTVTEPPKASAAKKTPEGSPPGKLPPKSRLASTRKTLRERNGTNPSANEIAKELGFSDKATIRKIRQWLKDQPSTI